MNCNAIAGRLTADATFTADNNERSKNRASFTLAVTDPRNSQRTDFFNVVCWGSKADYVQKGYEQGRYRKGCEAEATGHVHLNTYTNQNGQERSNIVLYANDTYSKVHPDFKGQNQNGRPGGYQTAYGQQAPYNNNSGNYRQQPYGGGYQATQYHPDPQANEKQAPAPVQATQVNGQQGNNGAVTAPNYIRNEQQGYTGQQYNPYGTLPTGGFIPGMYQG